MTDAKITEAQFKAKYGVDQVGLLPAELYESVKMAIADHVAAKRKS